VRCFPFCSVRPNTVVNLSSNFTPIIVYDLCMRYKPLLSNFVYAPPPLVPFLPVIYHANSLLSIYHALVLGYDYPNAHGSDVHAHSFDPDYHTVVDPDPVLDPVLYRLGFGKYIP